MPMPTFCPLMDRHFATMQAKLKEKNNDLDVRLLSVSFDPVTDTPPVLKRHAQTLGADPRIWTFLTAIVTRSTSGPRGFGVSVSRAMNDPRDITTTCGPPSSTVREISCRSTTATTGTPEQALADLRVMVGVD